MELSKLSATIICEIKTSLEAVSQEDFDNFSGALKAAPKLFVAGCGRSELILKAFAMRLMHLGLEAFVVGDAVTPAIRKGDFLLVASGSGETSSLLPIVQQAKKTKAKVVLITASPQSPLAALSDPVLLIPAPSPRAKETAQDKKDLPKASRQASLQPLATLFEQTLLILLDSMVLHLKRELGVSETEMCQRHANLQ
jgi:6-phospho-3-hexuloisomerase